MEVRYIEHMGTDLTVVNAARVSFDKESEWGHRDELIEKDKKLIKYLASHGHWTPFGHPTITLVLKTPMFVARQAMKHQVGFVVNEVSRRYVSEPPEFYKPSKWRKYSPDKKQGSSNIEYILRGQKGKCPLCKIEFTSKGNRQRYCSSSCQAKAWRSTLDGWRSSKWSRLKQSAARRALGFSISKDDIPAPEVCIYTGLTLQYDADEILEDSVSVDRIDNTKGYIPGNIQTISNKANIMKSTASDVELVEFAKNILLMHGGYIVPQSDTIDQYYQNCTDWYNYLIEDGCSPEQARMFMPISQMTSWYWTGSLAAWARFYNLRSEESAQKEIQEVAEMVSEIIEPLFLVSWLALTK